MPSTFLPDIDRGEIDVHSPWEPSSSHPATPLPRPPVPTPTDVSAAPAEAAHHRWSLAGLLALSMVSGVSGRALAEEAPPPDSSSTTQTVSRQTELPLPNAVSRARVDNVEINARIERTAHKAGINPELMKAVAWQESNWIHVRASGALVTQANRDAVTGEVLSVDSGIMQINDRAHPEAFPAARTLDGNLAFGARLLNDIVNRYGPEGVWHYNGSPDYQKAIRTHLLIRPWTAEIMHDHVRALTAEQQNLQQDVSRETKSIDALQKRVEATQLNLSQWERKVEQAATPAAQKSAERKRDYARAQLSRAQDHLTQAQTELTNDRDRLQALPAEIETATTRSAFETARVNAAENAAYDDLKAELLDATTTQVQKLEQQQRDADAILARLQKIGHDGGMKPADVAALTRQAQGLRTRALLGLQTWRPLQAHLRQHDRPPLPPIQKKLRISRSRLRNDDAIRGRIEQRLHPQASAAPASRPHD